nr:efflux RND transporter periplasmic adaptor subunit [Shewanella gelidii]
MPILILAIGGAGFAGFKAMKKPPEEKPIVDNTPIVAVKDVTYDERTFNVRSHGVVSAKYETNLVSQIAGEIVYLSESFIRGGFVKKGDILAKIDPSDYEAALTDAEANLAQANAALVQEKAFGKVAEDEWSRIKQGKPTALSLRKPQLAQELAKQKSAEAGLKRARRNLERTTIRAPYDALIESRAIGQGSYVNNGSPIGKLLSVSVAEVRLPVADKEIKYLSNRGHNAVVTIQGEYAGQPQEWVGKIVRNEGVIDSRSRMTYLVAEISDPYGLNQPKNELRFGSYVTARIEGDFAGQVTVQPRHLVVDGKVAVMTEEKQLKFVPVNVVRQIDSNVVISSGLKAGDKVITSALDYPIEGMALALPEDKILREEQSEGEASESDTKIADAGNKE